MVQLSKGIIAHCKLIIAVSSISNGARTVIKYQLTLKAKGGQKDSQMTRK